MHLFSDFLKFSVAPNSGAGIVDRRVNGVGASAKSVFRF